MARDLATSCAAARPGSRLAGVDTFGVAAVLLGTAPDRLQVDPVAEEYLEEVEAIRDGFLGGWDPRVEIDGKEVLDDALPATAERFSGSARWRTATL